MVSDQIDDAATRAIEESQTDLMISGATFAIDMTGIQADIEDLANAIDEALTVYGDHLVEPEDIARMEFAQARHAERAVSGAVRDAENARRKLNRDYRVPLDLAKARYDELMGPVMDLHGAYKQRRMELDELEKADKKRTVARLYESMAASIALPATPGGEPLVPFERIFSRFGGKWLNKTTELGAIELELGGIVRMIASGEERIRTQAPKHETEAWAAFWQTLDADAAIARDRELCDLEERQAAIAREREAKAASAQQAKSEPLVTKGLPETPNADDNASGLTGAESKGAAPAAAPVSPAAAQPSAERKPRVMLIDGATDDECRQIAALCKQLGVTGVFKGPRCYEAVKPLCL